MKKSLLILICLSAFAINLVNAQCTPNLTGPYGQIVPDTTVNLPHAVLSTAYGTDIQFFVPLDTVYMSNTVSITDFTLISITVMPPGFNYTPNPSNGVFPGNTADCLHISCASPAAVGTYPLNVKVVAHVTALNIPDTINITGYKIVIDSTASGVPNLNPTHFDMSQNMPNPLFTGNTTIDYSTPASGKMNFTVYNMLGQIVITRSLYAKQGLNQIFINSKELAPGIYMYSLYNGSQTITKRMVVGSR